MKSIILDTNILLDIFVFQDPRALSLRQALLNQQFITYSNADTLTEFADVLSRPIFALAETVQIDIMQQWISCSHSADQHTIVTAPWKCRDPDDQIFLDLAYTFKPTILISKDLELLKLASQAVKENIQITNNYQAFAA